jgi:hypothetical protein
MERSRTFSCQQCGYDLRQTIADGFGRCPECGAWHSPKRSEPARVQYRSLGEANPVLRREGEHVSIRGPITPCGPRFLLKQVPGVEWGVVEQSVRPARNPLMMAAPLFGAVLAAIVLDRVGLRRAIGGTNGGEVGLLAFGAAMVVLAIYRATRRRTLVWDASKSVMRLTVRRLGRPRVAEFPMNEVRISVHGTGLWYSGRGGSVIHVFAVVVLLGMTDAMAIGTFPTQAAALEFVKALPAPLAERNRWVGASIFARASLYF